jgi:hypothetical protein
MARLRGEFHLSLAGIRPQTSFSQIIVRDAAHFRQKKVFNRPWSL